MSHRRIPYKVVSIWWLARYERDRQYCNLDLRCPPLYLNPPAVRTFVSTIPPRQLGHALS